MATCGACNAFVRFADKDKRDQGECRRIPPQVIGGMTMRPNPIAMHGAPVAPIIEWHCRAFYPPVPASDPGCGGFRPRDPVPSNEDRSRK